MSAITEPSGRPWPREAGVYALQVGALAIVYAAMAAASLTWAIAPNAGTPVWPASGLALVALMLGGLRLWPAIVIGRLAASVIIGSPQPLWADLGLAVASVVAAILPAWHARKVRAVDPALAALPDMLWIVGAALVSAVGSGVIGMLVLWLAGTPAGQLPLIFLNWCLGNACGVLILAPLLLVWSQKETWRFAPGELAHLAASLAAVSLAGYFIFVSPPITHVYTWYLFPFLIWAAVAFSARGITLALLVTAAYAFSSALSGVGPFSRGADTIAGRLLLGQQFVIVLALTMLILAAVADERRGKRKIAASEARLREESQALEILNSTGAAIASELDLDRVVQQVTDAGVTLTGARFGAFFYNVRAADGGSYMLYALSGAPREAFDRFGMPRATEVFGPTFEGSGVVRSYDITQDPRYGRNAPHKGMPESHLPVRSYLAVPVKSRTGEVIGGLFFGHPNPGVFTERAEWIVSGVAGQAGIALDNARLYQAAQAELAERRNAEQRQRLLINELNHRVKNTLTTVQSIAAQTLRPVHDLEEAKETLTARIIALSRAHDVITARTWQGADLKEIIERAVEPFDPPPSSRFRLEGPAVWLQPRSALAIAMALHELGTNAVKYGALSIAVGQVTLSWSVRPSGEETELSLHWVESDGPKVEPPTGRGFGSRLIERGLRADLGGSATMDFAAGGLVCRMTALLPAGAAPEFPLADAPPSPMAAL